MNYIKGYMFSSYPAMSYDFTGAGDVHGGSKGNIGSSFGQAKPGENGTSDHSKCFPGYSGTYCRACEIGYFKYDYGYGDCIKCNNKPFYAEYTSRAQNSSICEYECSSFLESSSSNPDCLDPVSLQV